MTKLILLIEDSEDDVFFMERALKMAGGTTLLRTAKNGQVAIDYLSGVREYADRRAHPLPGLILLDLKLPRMPGLDLLKWIRSRPDLLTIPVVILSSSGEMADLERAYRLGANSFILKPSEADDLVALAKSMCDYWFKHNMASRASA